MRSFVLCLCLLISAQAGSAQEPEKRIKTFDFKLFIDDREVGEHQFVVRQESDSVQVSSKMSLDFKVWKVKRVTYRHYANEVWQSGCLISLDSETEKLGKNLSVIARAEQAGLVVDRVLDGKREQDIFPGCVRGFAYWNSDWLNADSLLNAESGIYIPVKVNSLPAEIDGMTAVQIVLPKTGIDLDYDAAGEWMALETKLGIGGTLRYQRVFNSQ